MNTEHKKNNLSSSFSNYLLSFLSIRINVVKRKKINPWRRGLISHTPIKDKCLSLSNQNRKEKVFSGMMALMFNNKKELQNRLAPGKRKKTLIINRKRLSGNARHIEIYMLEASSLNNFLANELISAVRDWPIINFLNKSSVYYLTFWNLRVSLFDSQILKHWNFAGWQKNTTPICHYTMFKTN